MSFYGNITNTAKAPFSFDRIYSSRRAMELGMATDDVYAGKFVLIEYDKSFSNANFYRAYRSENDSKEGAKLLYKDIGCQIPITKKENLGDYTNASEGVIFYVVESEDVATYYVTRNDANFLASESDVTDSSFYVEDLEGDKVYIDEKLITTQGIKIQTVENGEFNTPIYKELNVGSYSYYICTGFDGNSIIGNNGDMPQYAQFEYLAITNKNNIEEGSIENYLSNSKLDVLYFGQDRPQGYDSTVWQKIYIDDTEKYIMVAELNSHMPTMVVTADAPTMSPRNPHFDTSSTNMVYDLHQQPQWGFRVKSAEGVLSKDGMTAGPDNTYVPYTQQIKNNVYNIVKYLNQQNTDLSNYIMNTMNPRIENYKVETCNRFAVDYGEDPDKLQDSNVTADDDIHTILAGLAKDYVNGSGIFAGLDSTTYTLTEKGLTLEQIADITEKKNSGTSTEELNVLIKQYALYNYLASIINITEYVDVTNDVAENRFDPDVLYILEDGVYKSIKTVYIKASGVTAESFDPEILFIKTEDGEFISIASTYEEQSGITADNFANFELYYFNSKTKTYVLATEFNETETYYIKHTVEYDPEQEYFERRESQYDPNQQYFKKLNLEFQLPSTVDLEGILGYLIDGILIYVEILNDYYDKVTEVQGNIESYETNLLNDIINNVLVKMNLTNITDCSLYIRELFLSLDNPNSLHNQLNIIDLDHFGSNYLKTDEQIAAYQNNYYHQTMNIIQQYFFSDESTQWSTFDDNTQSYYYYDGNTELNWTNNPANGLPADIYYNKKGFSEEYAIKSDIADKIEITPTGFSQDLLDVDNNIWRNKKYNDEFGLLYGKKIEAPDTQELSIHLPSIGNTISSVWDKVWGPGDEITKKRNRDIDWNSYGGLRMVKEKTLENGGTGFTYDTSKETISTIAGAINSVHDLMGKIIVQKDGSTTTIMPEDLIILEEEYNSNPRVGIFENLSDTEAADLFAKEKESIISDYIRDEASYSNIYYFTEDGKYYRKASRYDYDADYSDVEIKTEEEYKTKVQDFVEVPLLNPLQVDNNIYYLQEQNYIYNPVYNKNNNYFNLKVKESPFSLHENEYRYDGSCNFIQESEYSWSSDSYYDLTGKIKGPYFLYLPNKYYIKQEEKDSAGNLTGKITYIICADEEYDPNQTYYLLSRTDSIITIEDKNGTTKLGQTIDKAIEIGPNEMIGFNTHKVLIKQAIDPSNLNIGKIIDKYSGEERPATYDDYFHGITMDSLWPTPFDGYTEITNIIDNDESPNQNVSEPKMFYTLDESYLENEVEKYKPNKYHYIEAGGFIDSLGNLIPNYILDTNSEGDPSKTYVLITPSDIEGTKYYEKNKYYTKQTLDGNDIYTLATFDFNEHENIIKFYITDEDLAKATVVDKSNYYVQKDNKKQYIVLAEDTFTSLEPNADLFKNAVFQEHEIYYEHIDHHVTADYQGHTQGEIWDRTIDWNNYILASQDNFDYEQYGTYYADRFGEIPIQGFYELNKYWIETHYKLNSAAYNSNLNYWADRYGDTLLTFYKPNTYYILDQSNTEYHDLCKETALDPSQVYYYNKASDAASIVHFWGQSGYNDKQYYKKLINYGTIANSATYNSSLNYFIDMYGNGSYIKIPFNTYSANKYWYRTNSIDSHVTQTTNTSTYDLPDGNFTSGDGVPRIYYYDAACTERVYFTQDITTSGKLTYSNFQVYSYTPASNTVSYILDSSSAFDPGKTYYTSNNGATIVQNLYGYEPNKFYYQSGTETVYVDDYTLATDTQPQSDKLYYLDAEHQIAVTFYEANKYIYDSGSGVYALATAANLDPTKPYYTIGSGDGTAGNPYVPGIMIQNLYQYEANKFYYSAGRSQINKPIYSLDSSSSLTNSRQYYLDSDGQIAVKMYKANTYYIKNINTVSESYTALTSNSINVNNTYYIDPEQDGIYKAIKFTNFDGSKGYYYLTKYIDSDVIKDTGTFNGNRIYYYDEACTVRAYFINDFNTNKNGKIRNTDFFIYTENISYPAIDNVNEAFNRAEQYYLDPNGLIPIVIEEYSANKYYIKNIANDSSYAHYILATDSEYDASKAPYYSAVLDYDINYDGKEYYHTALNPVSFSTNNITDCYIYTDAPCYRKYDEEDYQRFNGFDTTRLYYTHADTGFDSGLLNQEEVAGFCEHSEHMNAINLVLYQPYKYYYFNGDYNKELIQNVHLVSVDSLNKIYYFEEMQGFSRNYNTIHGLLLKLNQLINVGNPQTRDITTIQGALNRLQDEIKRLGSYDFSTLINLNTMIDNITVKARDLFNKLQAIENMQGGVLSGSEADSRYYRKSESDLLYASQNRIKDILGISPDKELSLSNVYNETPINTTLELLTKDVGNLQQGVSDVIAKNNKILIDTLKSLESGVNVNLILNEIDPDGSVGLSNVSSGTITKRLSTNDFTNAYKTAIDQFISPSKVDFKVHYYSKKQNGKTYKGKTTSFSNHSFAWKKLKLAYIDVTMQWHLPNYKNIAAGDWFHVGTLKGISPYGGSAIACAINGTQNDTNRIMTCQVKTNGEVWCRCSHKIYSDKVKGVRGYHIQINGFIRTD